MRRWNLICYESNEVSEARLQDASQATFSFGENLKKLQFGC